MATFRYDPRELLQDVITYHRRRYQQPILTEVAPDFWCSDRSALALAMQVKYLPVSAWDDSTMKILRISTTAQGLFLFLDNQGSMTSPLPLTHPMRRQGFTYYRRPTKTSTPLVSIQNTGSVHTYSRHRHIISLTNYRMLLKAIDDEDICNRLFTINSQHEWLMPHLEQGTTNEDKTIQSLYTPSPVPVTQFRQLSSGQKMITLLNQSEQVIRYQDVAHWSLDKLLLLLNWCADIINGDTLRQWMDSKNVFERMNLYTAIRDTIDMGRAARVPLLFPDSGNIERWHDRVMEQYFRHSTLNDSHNLTIHPQYGAATEVLSTVGFEPIISQGRLNMESQVMRHCVRSYGGQINSGNCAVYTGLYNNSRYTLEVRVGEYWKQAGQTYYSIAQLVGRANSAPPVELQTLLVNKLGSVAPSAKTNLIVASEVPF